MSIDMDPLEVTPEENSKGHGLQEKSGTARRVSWTLTDTPTPSVPEKDLGGPLSEGYSRGGSEASGSDMQGTGGSAQEPMHRGNAEGAVPVAGSQGKTTALKLTYSGPDSTVSLTGSATGSTASCQSEEATTRKRRGMGSIYGDTTKEFDNVLLEGGLAGEGAFWRLPLRRSLVPGRKPSPGTPCTGCPPVGS